jgi:hypothetical protein
MSNSDYSNQYWTWRIERLLDVYLKLAGEKTKILSIEPVQAMYCHTVNGERTWNLTKDYYSVVVKLAAPVTNLTRLRHVLDQNVNADVSIRGQEIILKKRPLHVAPRPYV